MNMYVPSNIDIVVRSHFNFHLNDVPRFWFNNDPFLTRVFDALSLTFPEGERYFIQSVRPFRSAIQDADLAQRVADFIRQEAQHGIAHDKMNQVLREQGMPIDDFISYLNAHFEHMLKHLSPQFNLALTAASEHLTALMAETFFKHRATLDTVHPYVRALFAWHAIEEMEHRDVAFDVMQQVDQVPESTRKVALLCTSALMGIFTMYRTNVMLQKDGFNWRQRAKMFSTGLGWFIGKNGTLTAMRHAYLDWFKADFHPNQHPVIAQYPVWVKTLAETQDPIQAGEVFWQAGQ